MWIVSGKSSSTTVSPIHQLTEQLESNVADILPKIHALTGFLFTIEQNFQVHQSVTTKNFESVIIASGDTDVFVRLIYHFS